MSRTPASSPNLYCSEDAGDLEIRENNSWVLDSGNDDVEDIGAFIDSFISPETRHPHDHSIDLILRQDAIKWITKDGNKSQLSLLPTTFLSLAAKMEDVGAPKLKELRELDPNFSSKDFLQMELLIQGNLDWRLKSITPFHYPYYFLYNLPCTSSASSDLSSIILKTILVIDFLSYPPSTAAIIFSYGDDIDLPMAVHQKYYNKVSQEEVTDCHKLMEKYLTQVSFVKPAKSKLGLPLSPIGVIDVATCKSISK